MNLKTLFVAMALIAPFPVIASDHAAECQFATVRMVGDVQAARRGGFSLDFVKRYYLESLLAAKKRYPNADGLNAQITAGLLEEIYNHDEPPVDAMQKLTDQCVAFRKWLEANGGDK